MYFPYFRGRQYELLALKELAVGNCLGKRVVPVVEPIKLTSTFEGMLKVFNDNQLPVALICNPSVGELTGEHNLVERLFLYGNSSSRMIPSVLFGKTVKETAREVHMKTKEVLLETLHRISSKGILPENLLTIIHNRDFLDIYSENFSNTSPRYTLCPDERQIRRAVNQNKVLFEDRFIKQERNANYPEDEFFSDDHLFCYEEEYIGFGDYSIVGNEYVDSGFAPYAVAIHIVYVTDDDQLRIRHFISDSNDDISDVARKYHEAVSKLAAWYNAGQQRQKTTALSTFLNHAGKGHYPGLPTVKKLSIMHHLELIGKYLDRRIT